MSQESDLQGQVDRLWREIGVLRERAQNLEVARKSDRDEWLDWIGKSGETLIKWCKYMTKNDAINESNERILSDILSRLSGAYGQIEALERGAKMEATEALDLKLLVGALERRVEALENAERTGCPSGYFTVNGGPLRPCLVTLMKRYEIGNPKTATQVDQALNERMSDHPPTCGTCLFNPASAIVLRVSCETCKWFKPDGPYKPYRPLDFKESGICRAHPMVVAKMSDDTCGEHSPR